MGTVLQLNMMSNLLLHFWVKQIDISFTSTTYNFYINIRAGKMIQYEEVSHNSPENHDQS